MYTKEDLIQCLQLSPLDEGGYYRRTYEAELQIALKNSEAIITRPVMSSIYYLLTEDSPIGLIHKNRSSIMHFFHLGGSVEYLLISPEGNLVKKVLGQQLDQGQTLQFQSEPNHWKAAKLLSNSYALLSEAVAPGFDPQDREMGKAQDIRKLFPQYWDILQKYVQG